MASWINDIQSKVLTIVSYKGKKKYQSKFPNINYTTDSIGDGTTNYPTIYLNFLPSVGIGQTFDMDDIGGYRCVVQVEVTVSNDKEQGIQLGKEIIWFTLETLQQYGFLINTPHDISTDKSNRRFVARCERTFGAGDLIG